MSMEEISNIIDSVNVAEVGISISNASSVVLNKNSDNQEIEQMITSDEEILEMQNNINYDNVSSKELGEIFEILRQSIATDEYAAMNGNFVNISDKNLQYWIDKPLKFTLDEDTGSYLIQQQNSNGDWVAMGFTTEEAVHAYLSEIEACANKNNSNDKANTNMDTNANNDIPNISGSNAASSSNASTNYGFGNENNNSENNLDVEW